MEAALRTVYEIVTKETLENINFKAVRGFEGVKEAEVKIGDTIVKVAVAHGLGNARKIMEDVKTGNLRIILLKSWPVPVAVSVAEEIPSKIGARWQNV